MFLPKYILRATIQIYKTQYGIFSKNEIEILLFTIKPCKNLDLQGFILNNDNNYFFAGFLKIDSSIFGFNLIESVSIVIVVPAAIGFGTSIV